MRIKQKLQDWKLLVTKNRKTQVAIVGIAIFIFVAISMENPQRHYAPPPVENQPSAVSPDDEAYNDLLTAFKEEIRDLKTEVSDSREERVQMKEDIDDYEQRTAEIFKKILERIDAGSPGAIQQVSADGTVADPYAQPIDIIDEQGYMDTEPEALESFGDLEEPQVAPPPPPGPEKVAFIAPADSVRVKLLAGVHAPTDGTPYPVVFKLVGDVLGPDGASLPLGEARLIAAAQGSLVDSRALFRLTTLSVRLPDGSRSVLDVDGWIVGEDGMRGMPGILIDPIGKAIAGAGMAAGIEGVGAAIADAETTTYKSYYNGGLEQAVTGDVAKYAAGRALTESANEWRNIVVERLNLMVPQVQVFSGREATAVFAQPVRIERLYQALNEESDIFSSLD